jgi:uncharacterized protein (TIGR03118 family)
MNTKKLTTAGWRSCAGFLLMATAAVLSFSCRKDHVDDKPLRDFDVINLVANNAKYHPVQPLDPTLINGFGVAWSSGGIAWVNSVGGHVSELYDVEGVKKRAVNIPSSNNVADSANGLPCGVVFTAGKGFRLPNGNGESLFAFTGFDGVLSAWNLASGNNAQFIHHPSNSRYTGMAMGTFNGRNFLYGANFELQRIDAWDSLFKPDGLAFRDPTLPQDYSPYNVQAIGDSIYVVYAKMGSDGHPVAGAGFGFVSIFTTNGQFLKRLASRGALNAPWGITMTPASFLEEKDVVDGGEGHGGYSNLTSSSQNRGIDRKSPVILVGNFGDGHINVFTANGDYLGQLQSHRQPIVIEGLWSLTFPPAGTTDPRRLYFSAGPASETDGVFGYIIKH